MLNPLAGVTSTYKHSCCVVLHRLWNVACFGLCKSSSSINIYSCIQYIPRNMHTVFALLCFVVAIHWLIFPYPSGLLHWHCGNLTIAPVPAKQPWWIWINTSCEFIMNGSITTTKQSTTKPCAYSLGYTVRLDDCITYIHICCTIPTIIIHSTCRMNCDGSYSTTNVNVKCNYMKVW